MGPQEKMFTKEGRETFLNSEYTVTSEFDRMGCRLEGPFIAYKTTSDIISDGIAFGSVQVPSHGKPIILLADRQTTGGYAKIATVVSVDIPKLVQRKTEQKVVRLPFKIFFCRKPDNDICPAFLSLRQ